MQPGNRLGWKGLSVRALLGMRVPSGPSQPCKRKRKEKEERFLGKEVGGQVEGWIPRAAGSPPTPSLPLQDPPSRPGGGASLPQELLPSLPFQARHVEPPPSEDAVSPGGAGWIHRHGSLTWGCFPVPCSLQRRGRREQKNAWVPRGLGAELLSTGSCPSCGDRHQGSSATRSANRDGWLLRRWRGEVSEKRPVRTVLPSSHCPSVLARRSAGCELQCRAGIDRESCCGGSLLANLRHTVCCSVALGHCLFSGAGPMWSSSGSRPGSCLPNTSLLVATELLATLRALI